jgi:DNA-binding GntR family transcriptional regulator
VTHALTPAQISEWAAKGSTAKKIAAHLAEKILSGRLLSFAEPPSNETLADEWDASERTVIRAKALLAQYGALRKENGTYYVT